jgi:hypothetical protein
VNVAQRDGPQDRSLCLLECRPGQATGTCRIRGAWSALGLAGPSGADRRLGCPSRLGRRRGVRGNQRVVGVGRCSAPDDGWRLPSDQPPERHADVGRMGSGPRQGCRCAGSTARLPSPSTLALALFAQGVCMGRGRGDSPLRVRDARQPRSTSCARRSCLGVTGGTVSSALDQAAGDGSSPSSVVVTFSSARVCLAAGTKGPGRSTMPPMRAPAAKIPAVQRKVVS